MSEKTPNIEKITAWKASDPKAPEQKATGAKKKLDPKKKKWLIAGIALLLVAAVAVTAVVLHKRRGGGDGEDMGVEVVTVSEQDMSQSISVTGKVASSKTMTGTSDLAAKVKTLNVELGDHVKKGDVLLTFDISDINEQIKTLEKQTSDAEKAKAREKAKLQRALDQAVADGNEAVKDAAAEADKAQMDVESKAIALETQKVKSAAEIARTTMQVPAVGTGV